MGNDRGQPRSQTPNAEQTPATARDIAALRHHALLELAAADKSNFELTLRRILERGAELLDVERVNCWQLESAAARIVCVSAYEHSQKTFTSGAIISREDCPAYFDALVDDPVILASDARTDARTTELTESYLKPHDIWAMMDVPIWLRGSLWGVICHEAVNRPRIWSNEERDFAISIGHVVSMALEARLRADAERVARLAELFMGILGHDLRTPLATIAASAQFLLARPTDDLARAAEQRIARNADRMERMITHLLDFARVKLTGHLPIDRAAMNIEALCRRQIADMAAIHPRRSIELSVDGNAAGQWDPDRLEQLISNLLGNALAHGKPEGRVWIRVDGNDAHSIRLEIGNEGTLSSEFALVIFDPFRRLEVRHHKGSGLGLGLFIAREIVHAHGGTITVDARATEIVFVVRLPRAPALH